MKIISRVALMAALACGFAVTAAPEAEAHYRVRRVAPVRRAVLPPYPVARRAVYGPVYRPHRAFYGPAFYGGPRFYGPGITVGVGVY
ncbi:MAG TPA: hypothetical protein PKC18_02970 [Lacipirellulaceae bacterium]|nr:hypothetical protein [Lacipirellulaceae bacterium]HMP08068.1 hypothetical protein [Lacipirellulaceae bacterium]